MTTPPDHYAVLGNPIAHSQSPFIHALFAKQTGERLTYDRVLSPLDGFAATIERFAREGGKGCNVTVPFKTVSYGMVASCTERARLAQATNVLRFDAAGLHGDNTDGAGLVRDIEVNAGVGIMSASVLLIGAGGAAAGALGPLLHGRPARVTVANRTHAKAQALVDRHLALAAQTGTALDACPLGDCAAPFDIVINATASSLNGADIPVAGGVLRNGTLALDMMYGPPSQAFLQWARDHGAQPRDGVGMLVEQAAEAFFVWRGVRPEVPPVLEALRERLALPKP
ncbi:MAG: aroE [Rhizobacter sp.]|nr:aroE [Rhizobacter sp.]